MIEKKEKKKKEMRNGNQNKCERKYESNDKDETYSDWIGLCCMVSSCIDLDKIKVNSVELY